MVVPPTALDLLRKVLRKRRQTVVKSDKSSKFRICPRMHALLQNAKTIGIYLPMGGEPDPLFLISELSVVTALPALSGHSIMTFRRWSPGDPLIASLWGGQQPVDTAEEISPDLIIVPLLGFDAACNRIGQGGGYYDRYLAAHSAACRVGLAWDVQRVDSIEPQPWDIPLDAILTETKFYVKDLTRCQHP
jgi:5-formyltetrahydrofolate cyclo-ligase